MLANTSAEAEPSWIVGVEFTKIVSEKPMKSQIVKKPIPKNMGKKAKALVIRGEELFQEPEGLHGEEATHLGLASSLCRSL